MICLQEEMGKTLQNSRSGMNAFLKCAPQEIRDQLPQSVKAYSRKFKIVEASELLNVSATAITRAEKTLGIEVHKNNSTQRREGYTLDQIHEFRKYFGRSPRKEKESYQSAIMCVASGKGGVGKSSVSIYEAEYLTLQGYRVLLIDSDPQATATTILLGVNPDQTFGYDDTIAPFLMGEDNSLKERVIKTGMPGLSIIPSCQSTALADIKGVGQGSKAVVDGFLKMRHGIQELTSDFDVIVIDCAPSVTYTNLRCILAANILIHPVVPALPDYASAANYESAIYDYLNLLKEADPDISFGLLSRKYLITRYNNSQETNRLMTNLIQSAYPCYQAVVDELTEVHSTVNRNTTIYQTSKAVGSIRTRRKAVACLDRVFREISEDIKKIYPHPDFSKSPVTLRAEQNMSNDASLERAVA